MCPHFGAGGSYAFPPKVYGWRPPRPLATHTLTSLTQAREQDAGTAVAQGVVGHPLVGAPAALQVSIPDAKVELGTLSVRHESGGAWFCLPSLGSQPEELSRWHAPQEGTLQPGFSPLWHRHPGPSHCQLWGFCRDREGKAGRCRLHPGSWEGLEVRCWPAVEGKRGDRAVELTVKLVLPVCVLFQVPFLCQFPLQPQGMLRIAVFLQASLPSQLYRGAPVLSISSTTTCLPPPLHPRHRAGPTAGAQFLCTNSSRPRSFKTRKGRNRVGRRPKHGLSSWPPSFLWVTAFLSVLDPSLRDPPRGLNLCLFPCCSCLFPKSYSPTCLLLSPRFLIPTNHHQQDRQDPLVRAP